MKTYRDLNLRAIRESCDLDFAHYTYKRGQCSCCYGPKDMAPLYWKNRKIPDGRDYTYILFKNAWNGSGSITNKDQEIKNNTCISYRFRDNTQKEQFCRELAAQLDSDYVVAVPKRNNTCIIIFTKDGAKDYGMENFQRDFYVLPV